MSIDTSTMSKESSTPPARKFLFERSFEEDLALSLAGQERTRQVFTLEQLEAAKQEAYQNGMAAGQKATMETQQQAMNALLKQVEQKLGNLIDTSAKHWQQQLMQLQEVGLSIARKIMPSYAEKHGLEEIETIISQVITEMGREPRLVVRIAEGQFDAVSDKIKEISERKAYTGKVIVLAEPELGPADCRVEWADGGIERDLKTLWQEIDKIMERVQTLSPPPSQPLDASGEKS